ncbi:metallophosphoesterase [Jeotgalibacillus salarius]|uniref:Metallophosphoesterase n=1 Tax=Jeotgalibacillus salarius TaxID=546023 RepID=A0A4Y8LHR6_9BACL|nr:metallophosphoesterase [Jeotgalibacillus salarius]TFE02352.1 metallophosphoesterase [Jeotgalibacillus salarius]
MKRKKWLLLLIVISFLIFYLYDQNNTLTKSSYTVSSDKISDSFDDFKILHLSDLHNKSFGQNQQKLVDEVKESEPDIIVITGDIIDERRYDEEPALTLAEEMVQLAPVYYVSGNHEMRSGKYDRLRSKLIDIGVNVLTNETTTFSFNDASIQIAGIEDPSPSNANTTAINLQQTFIEAESEQFTVLLAHRPEWFSLYRDYQPDLILSGHAHGGQIRLPFFGALIAPNQGLFPEYTSGVHEEDESTLIISRGLGNSLFPFRINNHPEVVEIILQQS